MAKHGKKKVRFHFEDIEFASFFLDFIRKKKFYARITGNMNHKGTLEFTLVGSPESIKIGIIKIKNFYHKAYDNYLDDNNFVDSEFQKIEDNFEDKTKLKNKNNDNFKMNLNKKKLKFDVI